MKVLKWVEFPGQELEINISSEDITESLNEGIQEDRGNKVLSLMNAIACALNGISDVHIKEISLAQKESMVKFLSAQLERYKEPRQEPSLDTKCPVCGEPQYLCSSGTTCKNGHGF